MRPPRYAQDEAELSALSRQAKGWACPSCRRHGTLNVHGSLRGGAEKGLGKDALRGRRFLCSNRGQRPGCGRTFSLLLATILRRASVRSGGLWRFYRAKFALGSVWSAWASLRSAFSVEAAYQWWSKWQRGQFLLRALLCRKRDPPVGGELTTHLAAVFGAEDPIRCFQASEQRAWPS
jgi:hypothetical protein